MAAVGVGDPAVLGAADLVIGGLYEANRADGLFGMAPPSGGEGTEQTT